MPTKVEIPLQHALVIIPALAAQQSAMAGLMKGEIEKQIRNWYAQGVSLNIDAESPLGIELKKKGYIK